MIYSIHEDDKEEYDIYFIEKKMKLKNRLRQRFATRYEINEAWATFNASKVLFDPPIGYAYAQTIYQSQGSGYNNIFVDVDNIRGCCRDNEMFSRSLYTAVSRAKLSVTLFCKCNYF